MTRCRQALTTVVSSVGTAVVMETGIALETGETGVAPKYNLGHGVYCTRHPPPCSSREDAVLWYKSPENFNLSLSMLLISRISVTGTVAVMRGLVRCLCKDSPTRDKKF